MGKKPAAKSADAAKEKKAKAVKSDTKELSTKAKKTVETKPKAEKCKVKACKREYRCKGYCSAHYKQWRQGKFGLARYKTCSSVECRKPMGLNRHGYCEDHYQSYYVKGVEVAKAAAEAPAEKKEAAA